MVVDLVHANNQTNAFDAGRLQLLFIKVIEKKTSQETWH